MFYNMLKAYSAIVANFHKPFKPLLPVVGIGAMRLLVSTGMALDHLFFPSFRRQKVEKPIVIVGNPRSGTTFLQRFMTDEKIGVGTKLWTMLFPSLTLQKIIRPFLPAMERISPARHHANAAHQTSLTAVETDDPSLLFHFFDGFFVYGFFLAWCKEDLKDRFDPQKRDTSARDFKWLLKMWKRNLYSAGEEQLIAKLFSLGVRIPQFLEYFPGAKILYTVRDPLETVPSGISLVTGVLDGWFGFQSLPEEKRNFYIGRLYDAFLELSMRFHDDYTKGRIDSSRVFVVRYDRMMSDFDRLMDEILEFTGKQPTPELKAKIAATAEKQRNFKSSHQYNLEKFGLTEDKIMKDYRNIYKTFFDRNV